MTWAQSIRHPWFNPPPVKRSRDDDEGVLPSSKRVKYKSLEHSLAHMTLASTPEDVDMWPPRPRTQEVIFPSSVEEPDEMDIEPTVTTGVESGKLEIKEVDISPAALECIKRQTTVPLMPVPIPTSQALVLYRAPRPPSPQPKLIPVAQEDDVMEVE